MEGQKKKSTIVYSSDDSKIEIEDNVKDLEYLFYVHEPGSRKVADAYTGYAVLLGDYPLSKRGVIEVKGYLETAFGLPIDICNRAFMTAAQNEGDYWDRLPSKYINGNYSRLRVLSYNMAISSQDGSSRFLLHVSPLDDIFRSENGFFNEYSSAMAAHRTISIFGLNDSRNYIKPYSVIGSLKPSSSFGNTSEAQGIRNNNAQAWNVVKTYCDYLDIETIMIPPDLKKYN